MLPAVSSHGVVNHSLHFVDRATGVHTQTVESYWNRVKTKLKRMKGCDGDQLPSYLDEFMWRERYGKTGHEAMQNMMRDIPSLNNVASIHLLCITALTLPLKYFSLVSQNTCMHDIIVFCTVRYAVRRSRVCMTTPITRIIIVWPRPFI